MSPTSTSCVLLGYGSVRCSEAIFAIARRSNSHGVIQLKGLGEGERGLGVLTREAEERGNWHGARKGGRGGGKGVIGRDGRVDYYYYQSKKGEGRREDEEGKGRRVRDEGSSVGETMEGVDQSTRWDETTLRGERMGGGREREYGRQQW